MQTALQPAARQSDILAFVRRHELRRLDRTAQVYLDYTGAAPYPISLLLEHQRLLRRGLYGNPHSSNPAAQASTAAAERAKQALLVFLDADPAEYDVVWTANATAALRLVGEAFQFRPGGLLLLTADNHNSVNGLREYARARGAEIRVLSLDDDLRLAELPPPGHGLFAFPAQSNFSGVQHPLGLVAHARARGYTVLLDAAAFVPAHPLSLRQVEADFVAISFYKLFGYPTGLGALIARRSGLRALVRPAFAGGTLEYASVLADDYLLADGAEAFQDGTVNYLALPAVNVGLALLDHIGMPTIQAHVAALTARLLRGLAALRYDNGQPLIRVYGPRNTSDRGGTVAFNVLTAAGAVRPFETIVERAAAEGISVRGGCFCNPGAAEHAFGYGQAELRAAFSAVRADYSHDALRDALPGKAVGAVRASVGYGSNHNDVDALLHFLARFSFNDNDTTGDPS